METVSFGVVSPHTEAPKRNAVLYILFCESIPKKPDGLRCCSVEGDVVETLTLIKIDLVSRVVVHELFFARRSKEVG